MEKYYGNFGNSCCQLFIAVFEVVTAHIAGRGWILATLLELLCLIEWFVWGFRVHASELSHVYLPRSPSRDFELGLSLSRTSP